MSSAVRFIQRWLEDPVQRARIKRWSCACLVVLVVVEIVLPLVFHGGHSHFSFESFPACGSIYGFVSCAAISVVSKLIGKAWLMRREDHYDA